MPSSFSQYVDLSAFSVFIEWAKGQIENYADMFRKQVYGSDVDPETTEAAIKITTLQSRRVRGLDIIFIVCRVALMALVAACTHTTRRLRRKLVADKQGLHSKITYMINPGMSCGCDG